MAADVLETTESVKIQIQPVTSDLSVDETPIVRIVETGESYLASQGPYDDIYWYVYPLGLWL